MTSSSITLASYPHEPFIYQHLNESMYFEDEESSRGEHSSIVDRQATTTATSGNHQGNKTRPNWIPGTIVEDEDEDEFNELAYSRGELFICNCDCICRSSGQSSSTNPHLVQIGDEHHRRHRNSNISPSSPTLPLDPATDASQDVRDLSWLRLNLPPELDPNPAPIRPSPLAVEPAEVEDEDSELMHPHPHSHADDALDDLISIEQIHDDLEILIDVYIFFETMRFMLHGFL